jgi:hypothetical protein
MFAGGGETGGSQQLLYTLQELSGGVEIARMLLEKSLALYEAYEPPSPLHPDWGREQAEATLRAQE